MTLHILMAINNWSGRPYIDLYFLWKSQDKHMFWM